jgi:hypothetical protein
MKVHFSRHRRHHLLLVVLLMIAILTGMRWNLNVVLICISFMARDGEHFFMCFWPFEFLLLRKFCLVQLPTSFGSLIFGEFTFLSSLYILVISPLSDV